MYLSLEVEVSFFIFTKSKFKCALLGAGENFCKNLLLLPNGVIKSIIRCIYFPILSNTNAKQLKYFKCADQFREQDLS